MTQSEKTVTILSHPFVSSSRNDILGGLKVRTPNKVWVEQVISVNFSLQRPSREVQNRVHEENGMIWQSMKEVATGWPWLLKLNVVWQRIHEQESSQSSCEHHFDINAPLQCHRQRIELWTHWCLIGIYQRTKSLIRTQYSIFDSCSVARVLKQLESIYFRLSLEMSHENEDCFDCFTSGSIFNHHHHFLGDQIWHVFEPLILDNELECHPWTIFLILSFRKDLQQTENCTVFMIRKLHKNRR